MGDFDAGVDISTAANASGVQTSVDLGPAPVKSLDTKHPFYKAKVDTWKDIMLLYEGGSTLAANANRLLLPRPKEPNEVVQARIARVNHFDAMATGVDWFAGKLFRDEPQIAMRNPDDLTAKEDLDPFWGDVKLDCNCAGLSLAEMMKALFIDALLYKTAWVLTDKPDTSAAVSLAQQKEMGEPYLVRYEPTQVYNWKEDARGNLEWVVFATTTLEADFLEAPKYIDRWYYFDRAEYRVYEADRPENQDGYDEKAVAKMITRGPHALAKVGRVPVRRLTVPDGYWFGNKTLLPSRELLNAVNALGWGLMMGCYAMPIFYTEKDIPAAFGESTYMQLGENDKADWLEHPGGSFATMMEYIRLCKEEIFRVMYIVFQGRDSSATAAAQSGYSKELDMTPANDVLQALGKLVTPFEQNILTDVAAARGEDLKPDVVGYSFTPDLSAADVDVVASANDILGPISETFRKWSLKALSAKAMAGANSDVIKAVTAEIDASPTMAEQALQEQKAQMDLQTASMAARLDKTQG